ncbi:type I secretion system permease/ATPase [uncultured Selenomonas sp.]|uniref:type I secretion system permease/ATPase n=1 Tax=uncultured Selenomonas sp. TaxID=159275 RepID=UPI0028052CBC|nr:type I secretion system permease/ATPase [uncultured Selenomonas sp.]
MKQHDAGIACLAAAMKMMGIPSSYEQLFREHASSERTTWMELLRMAKQAGLKARAVPGEVERLSFLPKPVILFFADCSYYLVLKGDERRVLAWDGIAESPGFIEKQALARKGESKIILLARRFRWTEVRKTFNLQWFIPVVLKYKHLLIDVLAASFFLQLFGLITPLFSQVIIDKVLVHKAVSTLDILALGILLMSMFEGVMGILRSWLFAHTTNRIDVVLGAKLFRHMISLPLKYFEVRRVGDTIARVRELDNIRQFITGPALTAVMDLFFGMVFILAMFLYSTSLGFTALAVIPFFVALSVLVTPVFRRRLNYRFACNAESQSYLVETVTGISTVKSLAIEPQMQRKWEDLLSRYVKASFRTTTLATVAGNIGQTMQRLSSLAILWFGAHLVMDGEITVGELIAFQMLSGRALEPVLHLVNTWQDFQQVRLSIERLGDVLNTPTEPSFHPGHTTLPRIRGDIVFRRVDFRYRIEGPRVIESLSLHIRAGMTIGIVGRSGSGKSTLTKLIQRLYLPERGSVLVDGIDLAQVEPSWLRQQIGVVLQDNYLFTGTIRENIAMVDPGASMEKVIEAARLAGAHDFILELPDGYDTKVGERGSSLSGGQRQRIAIARALMANPRILIFDEATSALDYESERIIEENLMRICQGRTVIIIAHRLTTVQGADEIVVLDRGRLVERGKHQDLLQRQGMYAYLYRQQQRKKEVG